MPREKAQAAPTARPKVLMRRRGADCPVVVLKRGNARGAKGAGHRRWERANWQQEELQFSTEGGGTSRTTRECQVRICERLGVKFPGPTRPKQPNRHVRSMVAGCRTWRGWLNSVLNDPHKTSCEFAYAAFTGSPFSNEAGNSLFLLADLRNKSARPAAATGRLKK